MINPIVSISAHKKAMCFKTLSEFFSKIVYRFFPQFRGYLPSENDLDTIEIQSLVKQLETKSVPETLTNVLDWEERNIDFWTERHPLHSMMPWVAVVYLVVLLVYSAVFTIALFLTAFNFASLSWIVDSANWFVGIWIVSIVTSMITIVLTMESIIVYYRKIPWKKSKPFLYNVFMPNISTSFILQHKLAVCRDFAKLTASLLLKIYPNGEIYFASAPNHVATGIKINNQLYMLDQRLPILTKNRWDDYRETTKSDKTEKFEVSKGLELETKVFGQNWKTSNLNPKTIHSKMTTLLKIDEKPNNERKVSTKQIVWKNGKILYEDDELVNYSLARYLKREIHNEMLDLQKISKLEILQNDDDLIFQVSFVIE